MRNFKSDWEKERYVQNLTKVISWRDQRLVGAKLFHIDFPKPDYVTFTEFKEEGTAKIITVMTRKGKAVRSEKISGWYLWKSMDLMETNPDTDLLNQIVEACRVARFDKCTEDYYKISEYIGGDILDLLLSSHRADELKVGTNG